MIKKVTRKKPPIDIGEWPRASNSSPESLEELQESLVENAQAEGEPGNLTTAHEMCESHQEREVSVPYERGTSSERARLREDFAQTSSNATLKELVTRYVPVVPLMSDQAVARLGELVRAAQKTDPVDRQAFVDSVRAILRTHDLRFRLEGEKGLAGIALRNGSIQFTVGRGGRSFALDFEIVRKTGPIKRAMNGPAPAQPT